MSVEDKLSPIFARRVGRNDIARFAELSNDYSPIHLDREYALSLGLKDNFAHGLLGASWASGGLAQLAPRLQSCVAAEYNFGVPIFCDDELSMLSKASNERDTCEFVLQNQAHQDSTHGVLEFGVLSNLSGINSPPRLTPDRFSPAEKVYFAEDMFRDGPRGACASYQLDRTTVQQYLSFTGEAEGNYKLDTGSELYWVPPTLIFCRSFSSWLDAFTAVATPDGGFPGHLKDQWRQHLPVAIGDQLHAVHQVTALRESKTRKNMALLTVDLQTINQDQQVVQTGSVLLMMQLRSR